eukprot:m.71837 g.71837  ORF g.71837 m.71837 type:complete len:630 (+) comp12280_c0_seq4:89-1978(+)
MSCPSCGTPTDYDGEICDQCMVILSEELSETPPVIVSPNGNQTVPAAYQYVSPANTSKRRRTSPNQTGIHQEPQNYPQSTQKKVLSDIEARMLNSINGDGPTTGNNVRPSVDSTISTRYPPKTRPQHDTLQSSNPPCSNSVKPNEGKSQEGEGRFRSDSMLQSMVKNVISQSMGPLRTAQVIQGVIQLGFDPGVCKFDVKFELYELLEQGSIKKCSQIPPTWASINGVSSSQGISCTPDDTASMVNNLKLKILKALMSGETMNVNDLARAVGAGRKREINPELYRMKASGLISKMNDSPPQWCIAPSGKTWLQQNSSATPMANTFESGPSRREIFKEQPPPIGIVMNFNRPVPREDIPPPTSLQPRVSIPAYKLPRAKPKPKPVVKGKDTPHENEVTTMEYAPLFDQIPSSQQQHSQSPVTKTITIQTKNSPSQQKGDLNLVRNSELPIRPNDVTRISGNKMPSIVQTYVDHETRDELFHQNGNESAMNNTGLLGDEIIVSEEDILKVAPFDSSNSQRNCDDGDSMRSSQASTNLDSQHTQTQTPRASQMPPPSQDLGATQTSQRLPSRENLTRDVELYLESFSSDEVSLKVLRKFLQARYPGHDLASRKAEIKEILMSCVLITPDNNL